MELLNKTNKLSDGFVPPSRKEAQEEEVHTILGFVLYRILLCDIMVDL